MHVFQALLHLLHHLRCHSPQALTYYRDVSKLPIAKMLQEAGHTTVDPCFIGFVIPLLVIVMLPVPSVVMLVSFKVD